MGIRMVVLAVCLFALSCCCAVWAEDWEPIGCLPYEGSLEDVFEPVPTPDVCGSLKGWKAILGEQNAQSSLSLAEGRTPGTKAVRIDYEFIGKAKYEYVAAAALLDIGQPGLYLGVWARGVGDGGELRFRVVDKSGECNQSDLGRVDNDRWTLHVGKIGASGHAWGGDGNKKLDPPLKLQSILLDRPERGYKGKGHVLLDGLTLMRRRKSPGEVLRVSVPRGRFGNVFAAGGKVRLRIERGKDVGTGKLTVAYRVLDYWNAERADGILLLGAEPQELCLDFLGRGHFRCILCADVDGKPTQPIEARFAIMDPAVPLKEVQDSFFGVCTHYRSTHWPLESMDLIARAGIKYIRDEMSWGRVERKKGVFEFDPRFDQYVDHALSLGIEPMIILDYANKNYDGGNFPVSDEAVKGFAQYCYEVVKRYKGKIRLFEIWNEWSVACGMHGKKGNAPENYAKLIAAAGPAVKKANPDAVVIGIGGEHSKHHFDKMEVMFQKGALKHSAALSVHSYRYPKTPEATDLTGEILDVRKLAERHGAKQQIWITEIGWPTHIGTRGSAEAHQARIFVRTHVQMLATGVVDRIFWYDFKDDGLNRFYNENNFGIVRHQDFHCVPKSAYVACGVMTRLLTGATFLGEERLGEGALGYRFRCADGSVLLVAWAPEDECEIRLPVEACGFVDLMGNQRPCADARMTLTGDPVYIKFRDE